MPLSKLKVYSTLISTDQKFFVLNLVTGLFAGGVAILLHLSIDKLMHLFGTHDGFTLKSYILGGLSLFGGAILSTKFMPVCSGSGIPRTKILLAVHHGIIHSKEWVTKIACTVLSLASGVPLGSEGPTIAISAGVGSTLGRFFNLPERKVKSLVYAGCSAGIAAAFNTPIAAVIFTMEEVIGSSKAKSMGPILISSLVASVTAAALIGQNSVFTPVHYAFKDSFELFFYLAVGIVAGFAGPLFMNNVVSIKKLTKRYFKHHKLSPIIASFVIVGLLSQVVPQVPGNGLPIINNLLQGQLDSIETLFYLLIFKFIACAFCYGAGITGGILMPILFLGAALGGLFGAISIQMLSSEQVQIGAYCLVGMGAFFASVIRTPFTSVILVFEMTRDYRIVLPLMLANLTAYLISERISPENIYEKMAIFEGYELPGHEEEDLLMYEVVESVYRHNRYELDERLPYERIIYPDQSLSYALMKLKRLQGEKKLKVVNRMDPMEALGELTMQDIFDHLAKEEGAHRPPQK